MDFLIDSTAFYPDPAFHGDNWTLLREFSRRTDSSLLLSAIVIEEVINKFGERLQNALASVAAASREISRLLDNDSFRTSEVRVPEEIERYRTYFQHRLRMPHLKVLPIPAVGHGDLVARDLARRKPFSQTGKGYRDALIWYSLIEHMKENQNDCALITDNHSDFCARGDEPRVLHDDLLADIKAAGIARQLHVCSNLGDFIERFAKPTFKKLDDFKTGLYAGEPLNLLEYLKEEFNEVFEGIKDNLRVDIPGVILDEPVGITGLGEPDGLEISDVLELNADNVYVEFETTYDAEIFAYVFKSDAYLIPEDSGVSVSDWDWNEHYVQVEASVFLKVQCGLTYSRNKGEVVNLEIKNAQTPEEY